MAIAIPDPETALRIYYSYAELSNAQIKELFNIKSNETVRRIKRAAQDLQDDRGAKVWHAGNVNTEIAFEAWHLDIVRMERALRKRRALGLEHSQMGG